VTIAPTINQSIVKASKEDDLIEEEEEHRANGVLFSVYSSFRPPIITFPSSIILEYDEEYVNDTMFNPDNAYSIPVFIGYRVWVPDFFFNPCCYLVRLINNWILFHSLIAPLMTINLSVEDAPSWADVYPVSSNIFLEISNDYFIVTTHLVVVLHNQAPPGSFTFSLHAESPQLHRIQGYLISRQITITVQ
jgi:hypothetical protein